MWIYWIHTVKYFVKKYPNYKIFNLDNLTYAGNLENLREIENYQNYHLSKEIFVILDWLKNYLKNINLTK